MNLGVVMNRVFRVNANPLFEYVSQHHSEFENIHLIIPIEDFEDASRVKRDDYLSKVGGFVHSLSQYDIQPYILPYSELSSLLTQLKLTHALIAKDIMSYHHDSYDYPHMKKAFEKYNVTVIGKRVNHYFNPLNTMNQSGVPYKVFTSFYKAFRGDITLSTIPNIDLKELSALISNGENHANIKLENAVDPEGDAKASWEEFLGADITRYKKLTQDVSTSYVSGLSTSLAYGFLDIRQILNDCLEGYEENARNYEAFIRELMFREFYYVLMTQYPKTATMSFIEKYRDMAWSDNEAHFNAWKEGKTGYPIVDAAMRKLNRTGYMHNRLRMVVAQFLTKNLFINWTWGEEYFRLNLIDYDNASNVHGWQWCASTGTDAVPYFRMFNPNRQSERFDEDGVFIQSELEELSHIPAPFIHEPTKHKEQLQEEFNITIGEDYPETIVDHKESRQLVMEKFKEKKGE